MELVANLWPIVDGQSQLIQRFAIRAYAMEASDSVISSTLKTLATTDFTLACQFPIPPRFQLKTDHGTLHGCVTAGAFNQHQWSIIEDALCTVGNDLPELQGVGVDPLGKPFKRRIQVSFPKDPYLVVTFLIEDAAGHLHVQ